MIGLNPAMISYAIKAKMEEILKGEYPEGLILKERTDEKIIFTIKDPEAYEGITLNCIYASVTYKGIQIIIDHGSNVQRNLNIN